MASTVIQPPIALVAPFADPVYALKSDNSTFKGLFTSQIGTNNAVMFQSNGYSFSWKPDNILYIDDANNMDVVYGVNPSASAQYWNNKVTYVGTTQLTSDVFECLNNQLKHTVSLVAPPRLPASYMGTPLSVAIGGVISYDSTLSIVADGVAHVTDFTTNLGLSFVDSTSKEVYSLPKIFAQDANGDIADGSYKVTFNTDGTISLYMMVAWSWLQTASYPVAIDPTVVVTASYVPSNGTNRSQSVVHTSNGTIAVLMTNQGASSSLYLYTSTDNGQTFAYKATINTSTGLYPYCAIACINNVLHIVFTQTTTSIGYRTYDLGTSTLSTLTTLSTKSNGIANPSIATDNNNNVWVSYQGTTASGVPYNVYAIHSSNAGSTWSSEYSVSNYSLSGDQGANPVMFFSNVANPCIFYTASSSGVAEMICATWNGSGFTNHILPGGNSWAGSAGNVVVDSNGEFHAFWIAQGVTYSNSSDGGNTWSTPTSLASNNAYKNIAATIDRDNTIYLYWNGHSGVSSTYDNVLTMSRTNGTWSSVSNVTSNTTASAQYAYTIWSMYNMNFDDTIRYVYQDNSTSSVEFNSFAINYPPNAPTLTPHTGFDATTQQTFTWTFSDPNPTDTQSAYQLQIVDTGNSQTVVDTGKVASTASSYTLNANTLTNGHNYQWRVNTWDSKGLQGTYSSYSTFSCGAAPSVIITNPINNQVLAASTLTVAFSYSDPGSNPQQSYQVQLLASDDTTVLSDSGTINGTNNQYTIPYTLVNGTTYHARVRATNSQGITSAWADNTFSTSFTLPATPTIALTSQSGYISLAITNPTPTGGQPAIAYNDIYRRKTGTQTWARIATNIANNGTYSDYTVASGQLYDYKVTANGNNQTSADSTVSSQSITFRGLMVHKVSNPSGLLNLLYQTQPKSDEWIPQATTMKYAGRTNTVVQFGENEDYTLSGTQTVIMDSDNQWDALNSMIRAKSTLCVRDGRGRKLFAVVVDLKTTDLEFGRQVDLEFVQVDFTEAV